MAKFSIVCNGLCLTYASQCLFPPAISHQWPAKDCAHFQQMLIAGSTCDEAGSNRHPVPAQKCRYADHRRCSP